jgi:DNA-binding transcriptional LysR family regulator
MLSLGRLRVLCEVAECGSLSAAADRLGYTSSAVSQQIATLEREVGLVLFERHPRGVTLTDAGEVLLAHAKRLLAGENAARSELDALARGERGRVRMGWFTTAGAALVPFALARFIPAHVGAELLLAESDPEESAHALRAGNLDLALVYQFELEDDPVPDLTQVELFDDHAYVGVATGHPLASRDDLTLADFAEEPWVQGVPHGATLAALPAACRVAGFEPRVVFRTDDHLVVQGLVAAGLGVALLPRIAVPTVRPDIVIKTVAGRGLRRAVRLAFAPAPDAGPTRQGHVRRPARRRSPSHARRPRATRRLGTGRPGRSPDASAVTSVGL